MSLCINEYTNYVQIIKVIYKNDTILMNTINVNRENIINILL